MSLDSRQAEYVRTVEGLSSWVPHLGQVTVGQAIFRDGIKSVFVQCGRKWGKTEFAMYVLWRIAQTYPNSPCYFIGPFAKQAREIVWSPRRLQTFGPREWLLDDGGIKESEMRLRFRNGSFIKVDGSDNYEAYRGPHFRVCVYEEYKDMDPRFRPAMAPNAGVLDGLQLFIGSPPDRDCEYVTIAAEHRDDPKKFFYQAPTFENPNISREWLESEKASLYRRGEADVWEREYEAKYIKGGARKIFPMISPKIIKPHAEVMKEIYRDRKKLVYDQIFDPAGASCFASLSLAMNPFTKKIYALDEIYETRQEKMTTKAIGLLSKRQREDLNADAEWDLTYDEAAVWFRNEWIDRFPQEPALFPSQKSKNKKLDGLSFIKDILLQDKLVLSDRCQKFFWELDNYFQDARGNIPKLFDHLIDCFRYYLGKRYYSLENEIEYKEEEDENFRGARPEDDFKLERSDNWEDWA